MIYINPAQIRVPNGWIIKAKKLTDTLLTKAPEERSKFIDLKRNATWADSKLVEALKGVVGNKCWYSEVDLTGHDPEVDHFRPKGKVVEIDPDSFAKTGIESEGYWWLAFDSENYRLSSQHANQRRVDENSEGGKWDFFPIKGSRAPEGTIITLIKENVLPLDPCSMTDVALMWFTPEGNPGIRKANPTEHEERRMKITTWLFHLDKHDTASSRAKSMEDIRIKLKHADAIYQIWQMRGGDNDEYEKQMFDNALSELKNKISDQAIFAGANRCAVQLAKADYTWIEQYNVIS